MSVIGSMHPWAQFFLRVTGSMPVSLIWVLPILLLSTFLALGGCASRGPVPHQVAGFGSPDAPVVLTADEDYRISPLDTLSIRVFQVADLSGDYQVDLTGNIVMPLIGPVVAAGRNTQSLRAELKRSLEVRYLENADISVSLKSSVNRNITVDGAVSRAGIFPVSGPMTLMQAVALGGGASENANLRRVAIFRQIEGRRMVAGFDLASIRRGESEDPAVYSGDIIIVDGSQLRSIWRDVLSTLPILAIFRPF